MEIDWGTALVGLIAIAVTLAPLAIIRLNKAKKEKLMMQSINEMAQKMGAKIHQHEFCGDFLLGFDNQKNKVFFYKQKNVPTQAQYVDLTKIKSCRMVRQYSSTKNGNGGLDAINRVVMSFAPANKISEEIHFELYNEAINMQLSGELQFGERWVEIISNRL